MTASPRTVGPEDSVEHAVGVLDEAGIRHLPVVSEGRVVGVVSDRDLLGGAGWVPVPVKTVADVMHAPPVTAAPEDSVVMISVDLVLRGIGCVPVVRDDELLGIVTELDILRMYLKGVTDRWVDAADDPEVATLMTSDPVTLTPDASLAEARLMARSLDIRHLPIVEEGVLTGILSDRDLRRALGRGAGDDVPVSDVASGQPRVLRANDPVSAAAELMVNLKISSLPVVDDEGAVQGIVTTADVLDHCMNSVRADRTP